MSASFHLFDPNKSIRFVRSADLAESDLTLTNKARLDGDEIRNFYENLIEQPSTSLDNEVKFEVSVKQEGEWVIKQEKVVHNKRSKQTKYEITERDYRLFFRAAELDDVETLVKYLRVGIDVNMKDSFGWTALMCASAAGSINVVDVLLQNDASVECLANGLNAEDLARRNKRPAIADYIMKFRSAQEERPGGSFETIEEAYCVICDKSHFDVNHDTSIAHLVNLEQQPAEGYCYGISVKNRGYRMLKSGGWNEGQGLGKNNAGRKYPIRTALKRDRKGLGRDKKPLMKVTHSANMDAARSDKSRRRTHIKHLEEQIAKKKAREIRLRRALE